MEMCVRGAIGHPQGANSKPQLEWALGTLRKSPALSSRHFDDSAEAVQAPEGNERVFNGGREAAPQNLIRIVGGVKSKTKAQVS